MDRHRRRVHDCGPHLRALPRAARGYRARRGNRRQPGVRGAQHARRDVQDGGARRADGRRAAVLAGARGGLRAGAGHRHPGADVLGTAQSGAGPQGRRVREHAVLGGRHLLTHSQAEPARPGGGSLQYPPVRWGPASGDESAPGQGRRLHADRRHRRRADRAAHPGDSRHLHLAPARNAVRVTPPSRASSGAATTRPTPAHTARAATSSAIGSSPPNPAPAQSASSACFNRSTPYASGFTRARSWSAGPRRRSGYNAPDRNSIGNTTKFITPAKFSSERMLAASTSPRAPSAKLVSTTAPSASAAPAGVGESPTSGTRMAPATSACRVPSSVAPSALPNATVLRRIGATNTMRSTPASRSVTVESEASRAPNITTMPTSPGVM